MSHFTVLALAIVLVSVSNVFCGVSPGVTQSRAGTKFIKTYWSRTGTVLLVDKQVQSLQKCALLCDKYNSVGSQDCSGFHLEPEGPTCKLFRGVIPGVAWIEVPNGNQDVIYRKGNQCPVSKGYAVYSVHKSQFCLKVVWKPIAIFSVARQRCNEDGGNLVDVESKQKYDLIKQLLTNPPSGSSQAMFYLGVYKTDKFRSESTGLKLQWNWIDPNNLGDNDCVSITPNSELKVEFCFYRFSYICEIVI